MGVIAQLKKTLIKAIPALKHVQNFLYGFKPYKSKFRSYYLNNGWGNSESKSGGGSSMESTVAIRKALPTIFSQFSISKMLDVPCGDFYWMKTVDLSGIEYTGADIVDEMIADNKKAYQKSNINFEVMDILKDKIPSTDLIFCRDCLFHLTNHLGVQAIENFKNSGSKYLLTTTFTKIHENVEIRSIGLFRPINLELAPYNMPKPLLIVEDKKSEADPNKWGKSMALWKL
jgi:SAM-dependent methyltransferase